MRSASLAVLALALLLGIACSNSHAGEGQPAGATGLSHCLERPAELPRAPSSQLPCDLVPPGLSL